MIYVECAEKGTTSDIEEFKKATESAVKWFNENCNPHQKIIIEMGRVELVSGDIGYPVKVPD